MCFQKRTFFLSTYKTSPAHVAVVYKYLLRNTEHTIADIDFNSTGLKMSCIASAVSRLLDMGLIQKTGKLETVESTYSQLTIVKDPKLWDKLAMERAFTKQKNTIKSLLKNKNQLTQKCVTALQRELKLIEESKNFKLQF